MIELIKVSRIILLLTAVIIYILIIKITGAKKLNIFKSLKICWVVGILAVIFYLIGKQLHLWHYTLYPMFFGLPLERFISASIAYGAGFGLIFWKLKETHSKLLLPFIIAVPFYGLISDYFGTKLTGTSFWSVDNPYWPIADFIAWTLCWVAMVILYRKVYYQADKYN